MNEEALFDQLLIIACGYAAQDMELELRRVLRDFGSKEVSTEAQRVVRFLALQADAIGKHPVELMNVPADDLSDGLRDLASVKRLRAAEVKRDAANFELALAAALVSV